MTVSKLVIGNGYESFWGSDLLLTTLSSSDHTVRKGLSMTGLTSTSISRIHYSFFFLFLQDSAKGIFFRNVDYRTTIINVL